MTFDDENIVSVKRSANFSTGTTVGFILKTQRDLGGEMVLGVYIPKLMMAIEAKSGAWEKSVSFSRKKIKNAKNANIGETTLKFQNYVKLPPFVNAGLTMPRYKKGEKVYIQIIDRDIKTMIVYPFSTYTADEREVDAVSLFVPARKKGGTGPLTEANSYIFKLDSEAGIVAIHMANEDGTLLPFTFGYDQKKKQLFMSDSKRYLMMDGAKDLWHIENEAKSVWEMKGDTISAVSKKQIFEATESMSFKTDKLTVEAKKIEVTGEKAKIAIEEVNTEYSKLLEKIEKWEASGSTLGFKFDKAKFEASVIAMAGKIAAFKGIYFTDDSDQILPTAAFIDGAGKGSINNPAMAAFPVVLAPFLTPILTEMAAKIDLTMALVGAPPTTAASVSSQAQSMQSKSLNA